MFSLCFSQLTIGFPQGSSPTSLRRCARGVSSPPAAALRRSDRSLVTATTGLEVPKCLAEYDQ